MESISIVEQNIEVQPRHGDDVAGLRWSLIFHGSILLAVVIKSIVFPGNPVLYIPSLRVDIVGLPDLLKKDLKNVPATKEIAEALKKAETEIKQAKKPVKLLPVADPDEMVLKPKNPDAQLDKKNRSALDRIKALAKLTGDKPESQKAAAPLIKGNKISKGSSLSGEARESLTVNYYDQIRDQLQQNWSLPVWISRQNYSAQVQIYIDAQGRLRDFRFVKPSGNSQFDSAVKKALADSQPFPQPPGDLSDSLLSNGVLIGFPL